MLGLSDGRDSQVSEAAVLFLRMVSELIVLASRLGWSCL